MSVGLACGCGGGSFLTFACIKERDEKQERNASWKAFFFQVPLTKHTQATVAMS